VRPASPLEFSERKRGETGVSGVDRRSEGTQGGILSWRRTVSCQNVALIDWQRSAASADRSKETSREVATAPVSPYT
jgi:hypothetical protein